VNFYRISYLWNNRIKESNKKSIPGLPVYIFIVKSAINKIITKIYSSINTAPFGSRQRPWLNTIQSSSKTYLPSIIFNFCSKTVRDHTTSIRYCRTSGWKGKTIHNSKTVRKQIQTNKAWNVPQLWSLQH